MFRSSWTSVLACLTERNGVSKAQQTRALLEGNPNNFLGTLRALENKRERMAQERVRRT